MTAPLVNVVDVEKTFRTSHFLPVDEETRKRRWFKRREVQAAAQIAFEIGRGEVFGLLGPNGAGKTTTVKMISGLVSPDAGAVYVDGLDVERHRRRILEKVGVVLEGTRTSIWPLTPLENLAYYGNLKNVTGKPLVDRSHDLLDFIGLKDQKNVQVRHLSRGQKQKLAICIALIADPQVLLLDEPTTGLDVQSSRAIKDRILEMTRALGKSVLVTTHDMHVAQELCDRIGIIDKGRMVACKPTAELIGLFSDYTFVFHLDRAPGAGLLDGIAGVLEVQCEGAGDGAALVTRLDGDAALRSQALYAIVERLRAQGHALGAISQRQTNLESVFLRLTTSSI